MRAPVLSELLEQSHPLCREVVQSFVHSRPGVYLVHKQGKILYVGRAHRDLRRRLSEQAQVIEFQGASFSLVYTRSALQAYRLEALWIQNLKKSSRGEQLQNRIFASMPPRGYLK